MRKKENTSTGTSTNTTQAPSANLVTAKMIMTTKLAIAPMPLSAILGSQCGSCASSEPCVLITCPGWSLEIFRQRTTMPACDSVNERNTPIAYSGISADTSALNTTISAEASSARSVMPHENTSRLPRNVSWRGRKRSPACRAASRGKSAKEVLAAMIRISVVAAMVSKYNGVPAPTTARVSCEMTVSAVEGTAPI